ncbi:MAG TPA: DUF6326 family protein [Clostridia bacterium]|nr:DUF6326 family protein [Clostridia bacterium]
MKNNSGIKIFGIKDRKVLLSTLWIFVTLNYLYCDVLSLMDPDLLKQFLTGTVGSMHMTQGVLFGAAILMEIPISLVLLSRILKYKANRWANMVAGTIMTVVQLSSLFTGAPSLYYNFFSIIEITCTIFIFIVALKWSKNEEQFS